MHSPARTITRRDMLRLAGMAGAASLLAPRFLSAQTASTAAPSAASSPGFYRFNIGDIEALAVNDGGMAVPLARSPFGVGEPREKLAAVLRERRLAEDIVRMTFNVLLLRLRDGWVMVDAGCGNLFGPAGGRLVTNLAAAGLQPSHISAIVVSHLHGDHFGGLLDADRKPAFPGAKLFLHRREHEFWSQSSPKGVDANTLKGVQTYLNAFEGQWQLVSGGDKLFNGVELIDAPGHTPGHFVLMISSGQEQVMHWVDAVHHHAISAAHPEWVIGWDVDPQQGIATRKKILDRAAAERARIFGSHMPFPGLGAVRPAGSGYEFLIEPWVAS